MVSVHSDMGKRGEEGEEGEEETEVAFTCAPASSRQETVSSEQGLGGSGAGEQVHEKSKLSGFARHWKRYKLKRFTQPAENLLDMPICDCDTYDEIAGAWRVSNSTELRGLSASLRLKLAWSAEFCPRYVWSAEFCPRYHMTIL